MPLMSLEPPAKSCSGVRPLGGEPGATASWVPELKHQDIKGEDGSGRGLSSFELSLLLGSLLPVLQLGLGLWPKQPRELCLEEAIHVQVSGGRVQSVSLQPGVDTHGHP